MDFSQDRQLLKIMRSQGVIWPKGRSLPRYSSKMSEEQKAIADLAYEAMSEAFIDRQATKVDHARQTQR
jgi:hypothetical protein